MAEFAAQHGPMANGIDDAIGPVSEFCFGWVDAPYFICG
jgi:hypothetical protein